jgi:hypothetical protein
MPNLALMGAPQSGKTWLAERLTAYFRHGTRGATVDCNETTELAAALSNDAWPSPAELQKMATAHRRAYGFTLLTGLDIKTDATGESAKLRAQQAHIDSQLRRGLAECGIAFKVIYGTGLARLDHALMSLDLHSLGPQASDGEGTGATAALAKKWVWVCEKCSDPGCEHRLFAELQARRAAVQPG